MPTISPALHIRELLRVLVRKLGVLERGEASCCEITLSQCHTIVEIGRAGVMSINQLSELLGLDKSTVSRSVDKLVNDGLLVRTEHQDDRRYVVLQLTEEGQKVFAAVEQKMTLYFEEAIQLIPQEKRDGIIESLQYLLEVLKGSRCC
jgi:DNA-binding MarR family transcriptional regulator